MLRQMIEACEAELGYTESPRGSNRQKFAALAGHANGYPWCATFLVAMARKVGLQLPSESPYTPRMASAFKAVGQWSIMPQVGDFAFHDFPDSTTRIQHVDLVVGLAGDRIVTIGGNTSPDDAGSQDNGGGVYKRTRTKRFVVGYGRPDYREEGGQMADPKIDDLHGLFLMDGGLAASASGREKVLDPIANAVAQRISVGGIDYDLLAKKVADEIDRRARERLE